jgi:predicted transglutaminase-like cysteine proteinase
MRLLLVLCFLGVGPAFADPPTAFGAGYVPWGFYGFCRENPVECEPTEQAVVSAALIPEIDRINRETNTAIAYKAENNGPGFDKWTVSPTEGDCDDYTVTKRQRLIELGVPRGAMRIAFVQRLDETPHIFLIVSTTSGDFVLDNFSDEIYELERAMVLNISVQDSANPQRWWQVF